jgi:hypothetical protein
MFDDNQNFKPLDDGENISKNAVDRRKQFTSAGKEDDNIEDPL